MKFLGVIAGFFIAAAAWAQPGSPAAMRSGATPGTASVAGNLPGPLSKAKIDQRLDQQVPLNIAVVDEHGQAGHLGDYFRSRPVVLALVYYECRMLCNLTLTGLSRATKAIPNLAAGHEYDVVAVSFDPSEGPAQALAKRNDLTAGYTGEEAAQGWHFLTGDEESVRALAESVGFQYEWDPRTNQWAHSTAIMVLTPEGRVSKYFYGVEYSARDLRLGLVDASAGKIGSVVDQVLLFCYHYDPVTGKYGAVVMTILRLSGAAMVGAILLFWFVSYWQGRRRRKIYA